MGFCTADWQSADIGVKPAVYCQAQVFVLTVPVGCEVMSRRALLSFCLGGKSWQVLHVALLSWCFGCSSLQVHRDKCSSSHIYFRRAQQVSLLLVFLRRDFQSIIRQFATAQLICIWFVSASSAAIGTFQVSTPSVVRCGSMIYTEVVMPCSLLSQAKRS